MKGVTMNKKEFINKVTEVLKDNNIRKNIPMQKTTLHISDDEGNSSNFVVRKKERGLLFTAEDVSTIIEACLAVIEDNIKKGESTNFQGFGTIGVHFREARRVKHPDTHEEVDVDARYVPKFTSGNSLKMAAKIYSMSVEEREKGGN